MREIKFEFIYKVGHSFESKIYTLDQFIESSLMIMCDLHDNYELIAKRQSTGLKDKNGKEIYEGDLIELNQEGHITARGEVMFKNGGYEIRNSERLWRLFDLILDENIKLQKVGNIYENPELLNK